MRTALIDVTGEARTINVYPYWWCPFPVAVHKQALSIGGLLNMPDIGQEYDFPGHKDVTTAVGIAVAQSYRLIGEADAPSEASAVTQTREALERVQSLALKASLLTAEIVALRHENRRDDALLKDRAEQRRDVEVELDKATEELRTLANKPGIIVARWSASEASGAHVGIDDIALSAQQSGDRSGFLILGGLRVVSVAFGEDFWWSLNNLRPHEKEYIEQIGITTSLLQARDVAYTSDVLVRQGLGLRAAVGERRDDRVEASKLSAYWSFVGQYTNSGNLSRITWRREPFCMVCSADLPGLAEKQHRALQAYFDVSDEPLDAASFQGWRTISANITFLRDVPFFLDWKKHAEKYTQERQMYPSPSCPFCGKHTGPATIRGVSGFAESARTSSTR